MITINPIKLTTNQISFGKNNNTNKNVGLMILDKNPNNTINFEKDLNITNNADPFATRNIFKAVGYNFVKACKILNPAKRNTEAESKYIHVPYMA